MLKSRIETNWEHVGKTPMVYETELPELEARFALNLLERWGMVMAEPDGEDTAGRQKLKLMSPNVLVERAFEVARLAMAECRTRGLMHTVVELPDSEE